MGPGRVSPGGQGVLGRNPARPVGWPLHSLEPSIPSIVPARQTVRRGGGLPHQATREACDGTGEGGMSAPIRILYLTPADAFFGSERSLLETIKGLNRGAFKPMVAV